MIPLDQPEPIRAGEELDSSRLAPWLREHLRDAAGGVEIQQFRKGHSNLTYLVRADGSEYVLRRPPFGNVVKTAHDMGREFRVLSALAPVFSPAPRPIVYCDDESVLGVPFYLMERRRGMVLRTTLPPGFTLTPALASGLCSCLVDTLIALHSIDYRAVGLDTLGKPDGYVKRQVTGWAERYRAAATEAVPEMDQVVGWLLAHLPPESGVAVIHNDYKFDNIMLSAEDPTRVAAIFDWEMATVGDPLMDVGTALSYWYDPTDPAEVRTWSMGPTMEPGMWSRRRVLEAYLERTGRAMSGPEFYFAYGLFKLAVVVQQLHARYVRGFTKDIRFADMNEKVVALTRWAVHVAESGTI